ncbi:MAG TPA: hypothetical protein VFX02_14080 [Gammaproteobacteria bacterium]|nr:hypothetical protein [Gammaproteobacteria bacterium]
MSRQYPKAEYLNQILGKTISGVVIKEHLTDSLRSQVFHIFSDNTHFEFYSGDEIVPIKGIRYCGMDWVTDFEQDKIVYQSTYP